jgi:hypothetical protein
LAALTCSTDTDGVGKNCQLAPLISACEARTKLAWLCSEGLLSKAKLSKSTMPAACADAAASDKTRAQDSLRLSGSMRKRVMVSRLTPGHRAIENTTVE